MAYNMAPKRFYNDHTLLNLAMIDHVAALIDLNKGTYKR